MWFREIFRRVQPRRASPVRSRSRVRLEEFEPRIALAGDPGPFGHDPSAIRQGNWYYLLNTGGTIPIQKSTDLIHWQGDGSVFATIPAWVHAQLPNALSDIWAPDISYFDGVYHLYYAVASSGGNDSVIGLATNVTLDRGSPSYRWVDRGLVIRSYGGQSNFNAIDPNAVLDAAGNLWLEFGSFYSGIKMRQLDRTTGLLSTGNTQMYSLAARPSPDALEGPFIFRHDNYYYLFASIGYCCMGVNSTYQIVVGRSQTITGPYLDRGGQRLDQGGGTLVLSSYDTVRGPGGESVFQDANGAWLVHHFYDAEDNGRAKVQLRPLVWSPDDWPLAGEPYRGLPPLTQDITSGTWLQSVAFGPEVGLRFYPDGRINDPNGPDYWTSQGNVLTMHWPDPHAPGGEWVDTCILSADGRWLAGRNQANAVIRARRAVLPGGWADGDIGAPGVPGYADYDSTGGTWTVGGGGADIWNASDQFHFTYQSFTGDGEILARVTAVGNTGPFAKAGVMIRESLAANARHALVDVTPTQGVEFIHRTATGANAVSNFDRGVAAPYWVRLARQGTTFTAFDSPDGTNWHVVGSQIIPMGDTVYAGLAVCAFTNAALDTATFANVSVLPGGWRDWDVGSPGRPGSADFDPAGGTWTVAGGGADVFGTADAFHFAYQPLTGDGEVMARVTGEGNTGAYAKAGVMIRETLAADSAHTLVDVTPGHGVELVRRTAAGGGSASTFDPGGSAPYWVRLVRQGDTFTAYDSPDGVSWNWIDSATIPMAETVYAGLAVCAFNNGLLNAATFGNVAVVAQADLSDAFDQTGAVTDGTTFAGGLDGNGDAYSATLLGPTLSANGSDFNLGAADGPNVVQAAGQTVNLPAGQFRVLNFLGTGVNGPQPGQTFVVNYADGSSDTFTQDLSDWLDPQGYGGESVAAVLGYYNYLDGSSPAVTNYLYQYSFVLNPQKMVSSITLPDNGNVVILAIDLSVLGTADQLHFASQNGTDGGSIPAQATGVQNADPWAKAGVMFRDSAGTRTAEVNATQADHFSAATDRAGRTPTAWTPRRRAEALAVMLAELDRGLSLLERGYDQ